MKKTYGSTLSRKQQIVQAARKLVIEYGSENVTVRKIAKEVGFSEAAVYRHFKGKKEILFALVENIRETLISGLESKDYSGPDLLMEVLMNHLSEIEMRRGVSFQVIAEIISLGDRTLNHEIYEVLNQYIDKLKALLSDEVKGNKLRKDIDIDANAMILFSIIQALSNLWTLSNYSFNPREKLKPIMKALYSGLK